VDEADVSVNAARALAWTGFMHDPDVPQLPAVMREAYRRMRAAEGGTPSPVLATYAGLQAPGLQDTIEVGDPQSSLGVVIFLHGFAGSFTLPCWVVSRAAAEAGFATVCPATRWAGDWWSKDGQQVLESTIDELRARGAQRVVLAGLSNGGIGASLLAPRLRTEIAGLIVISGASPEAASPSIPVLAIHGAHDAQISAGVVRAYATRVGGRYVSLDAGHFALLAREVEATAAITAFLRARVPAPQSPTPPGAQGAHP
jgi:pimeloyl-ACP methyl ester carboxylesterase